MASHLVSEIGPAPQPRLVSEKEEQKKEKHEIPGKIPAVLKYFEILSGFGGLQIAQMVDEQKRCEKNR